MADDNAQLTIDGKAYEVDPDDLELWEVELLEDEMDCSLDAIDFNRAKAMRVLAYLMLRRDNPKFSMEDAKHLKLKAFGEAPEPSSNGNGTGAKRPTKAARGG